MARRAKPTPLLERSTQALRHGASAYGARFVRAGLGLTPGDDLRFALGWPHLIDLAAGHPEDATPVDSAFVALTTDLNFFRVTRGPETALRTIRGFALEGPGLLGTPDGRAQVERADPLTSTEACEMVATKLQRPFPGDAHRLMLLAEALVGPEPVIEGAFIAMRTWPASVDKPLPHHIDFRRALEALGYLLLRVPEDVRARYLEEWQSMRRSWGPEPAYSPITYATRAVLDPAFVWTPSMNAQSLPSFIDGPADVISRWRLARSSEPVGPIPSARMVFLGGDPVYDVSLAVWRKPPPNYYFARGERARAMFEHFGPIRSPHTVALMAELAGDAPAGKLAREWLARQAAWAAPILKEQASATGQRADWARAAAASLD